MSELVSIEGTRVMLGGVSRQTIYNLIADGSLQRVHLGRRAFITRSSIEQLVRALAGLSGSADVV